MHSESAIREHDAGLHHVSAEHLLRHSLIQCRVGRVAYTYSKTTRRFIRCPASAIGEAVDELAPAADRGAGDDCGRPHRVHLELLGTSLLVRCRSRACAAGIAKHFSAPENVTSSCAPDFVIDVDWPVADRYLFRARGAEAPLELAGVRVMSSGDDRPEPWRSHQPPLPPFELPPLAGRFTALHAAALTFPGDQSRAVLVLGDRGAGKTTAANDLANEYGFGFLTDETAVIGCRSTVVWPFPRELSFRTSRDDGHKSTAAAVDAVPNLVRAPAIVSDLVFLNAVRGGRPSFGRVDQEVAMAELLHHNQFFGSPMSEAVLTLGVLANQARAWAASVSGHGDLLSLSRLVAAHISTSQGSAADSSA